MSSLLVLAGACLLLLLPASALPLLPNPMEDPAGCGRDGVAHSAVCDPARLMPADRQEAVEQAIGNATSAEIAVVLVERMPSVGPGSSERDIDSAAKQTAMQLHDAVCGYR
jgi:hypothetical protein